MTDETLAQRVRDAANALARAMNDAGKAGLGIKLEMRPHNRDTFEDGRTCVYGYLPIISITRTIHPQ